MKKFTIVLTALIAIAFTSNAQWQQTNGPTGGDIRSSAISGTNIFIGTPGDGVFLSTNNGTSWTAVNTGLTNTNVYSLTLV